MKTDIEILSEATGSPEKKILSRYPMVLKYMKIAREDERSGISDQQSEVDWKNLRHKYFDECTDNIGNAVVFDIAPHDLFEWFKANVKQSEVKMPTDDEINDWLENTYMIGVRESRADEAVHVIKTALKHFIK